MQITIYNRQTKQFDTEKVFGENFVKLTYGTFAWLFFSPIKRLFSFLYGLYQDTRLSSRKISKFIQKYSINMNDFEEKKYKSFNDFFIRQFKKKQRPFPNLQKDFGAFCEGRYFAFQENQESLKYPVKGQFLTSTSLLENKKWSDYFQDGAIIVARLAPVDYHWFHFPDDCEILETYKLSGHLDSVNPYALKKDPRIFCKNERQVTILKTKNFGTLCLIEVGAIGVGKIIQKYKGKTALRGQAKGFFLFGGSTVIVLTQKGNLVLDDDILKQSQKGIETYLKLGEKMAECKE